jgi:hypothetical protein
MTSSRTTWRAVGLIGLLGIAFALGYHTARPQWHDGLFCPFEPVPLASELDAEAAYFFDAEDSPIKGILRSGAEVRVHALKGGAVYASVDTVLDQGLFEQAVKPQ